MEDYQSLSHTTWQFKYHIILIPRYRRKKLYGVVKRELGPVFRRLAEQKECKIIEGHILPDHVHMLISIPPKLAVSSVVGFIKGKSAIHVARHFLNAARHREWSICLFRHHARVSMIDTIKFTCDRPFVPPVLFRSGVQSKDHFGTQSGLFER